jgi:hypothetical protein
LWKVVLSIKPERLSGNVVDAFCTGQIIYQFGFSTESAARHR